MEEILGELKKLREEKGIGLDEIHNKTKIPKDKLRALEEGNLELLPEPVFVVGYVEKYLRVLGEDPGPILSELRKHLEEKKKEIVPPVIKEVKTRKRWFRIISIIAVFALVAALTYILNKNKSKEQEKEAKSINVIAAKKAKLPKEEPGKPVPSPTEKPQEEKAAPKKEHGQPVKQDVTVIISAEKGPCWIRYMDKMGNLHEFFLREKDVVKTKSPIVLRAGNAGSLRIELGGRTFNSFGKAGEVVNLKIDKNGIETLSDVPKTLKTPFPKVP